MTKMMKPKRIVLYTFPPVPHSYSFSPFAVKAEGFLRANSIPFETCYTTSFGKNGTIPYLRIFDDDDTASDGDGDGSFDEISDSNEIIHRLLEDPRFDIKSDANLTKEQKAIAHACLRMLEEHTTQTAFHFRYALNMPEFCEVTDLKQRAFGGTESRLGSFIYSVYVKNMPKWQMVKSKARGFLRYSSTEVVWAMATEDLKALETLLSDNKYFFGQSHPSTIDCTVFGHLSQILYIRMDFPQQKYLKESCPNLLRFMEYFRQTHFPDWEIICQKKPNDALKAGSTKMKNLTTKLKKAALFGTVGLLAAVVIGVKFFSLSPSTSQEL